MNRLHLPLFFLIFIIFSCSTIQNPSVDYTKYVDPMIGTDASGHMIPGPNMPFGMIQLSPDTYNNSCCSGYRYMQSTILGFSHTHLHGTGGGDYGDILLMPTVGEKRINPGIENNPDSGYRSRFKHENEKSSIGYYSVVLEDYNIKAELTTTKRVGFHKYNFPSSDNSHIVLDLKHSVSNESSTDSCYVKIISNNEIEGLRHSRGWANNQYVYFVIKFSQPFEKGTLYLHDRIEQGLEKINGKNVKAIFDFKTDSQKPVLVKVAISAVSVEGARKNLKAELPDWDFDATIQTAKKVWNHELKKIHVDGGTEDQKRIFYTAYYHALLTPNLYMDVDGKYRGMDHNIHNADDFNYYTVFSLWDTYRALHPLLTILNPDRNIDFCKTMLKQYEHSGLLPVWELAGCETGCMIGYHSVPVFADMYLKGYDDFDVNLALEAMQASGNQNVLGINFYRDYEFIPRDMEHNSVSKVLEYAYDDWCIAQFAKKLGNEDVYKEYIRRSQFYKNQFDTSTGLMRGRYADGTWKEPFEDLKISMLGGGDFTEANAWHYSFYVPQNVPEHIKMLGGDDAYNKLLDEFFSKQSLNRGDFAGQPGFGLYAHGNEPSHHMPYLYNFSGQPWKTQLLVRKIMDELYTTKADGLCGNDDCGQMSAWYIFSAMGFYPVTPGQDMYIIGTPLFEKVSITLSNGKKLEINAKNLSSENIYIQSITRNGENYSKAYFTHSDIIEGGNIVFYMGSTPNKNWGVKKEDRPFAIPIEEDNILKPLGIEKLFPPKLNTMKRIFTDSIEINLDCLTPNAEIFYTLDGTNPDKTSIKFIDRIIIKNTSILKTIACKEGFKTSEIVKHKFYHSKIEFDKKIAKVRYIAPESGVDAFGKKVDGIYSKEIYSGGGKRGLIDGKLGTSIYNDGYWQGFEAKDMEVIVDLGYEREINQITVGFLKKYGVWIFLPTNIEFFVSDDNNSFESVGKFKNDIDDKTKKDGVNYFSKTISKVKARYIKIYAKNPGLCPEWHIGSGGKAWIFTDEIIIE